MDENNSPVLHAAAQRMEAKLHNNGIMGFDFTILIQLLPGLISLFQNCKHPTPPPPNPNPSPTPAQAKAWDMKSVATAGFNNETPNDYDRHLLHATAQNCKRTRKKNGDNCKPREALELARNSLDEARNNDIDTIAAAIDESHSA